ncbi:uncharacterized protein LOC143298763 isoform X1 [Babylonia areolata]|uniref:uncharacterized protein LOC143298763 isoform X1 n=2 Tax=Babylonia areolata TaxID=304850 RepID=UPI003FCF67BE
MTKKGGNGKRTLMETISKQTNLKQFILQLGRRAIYGLDMFVYPVEEDPEAVGDAYLRSLGITVRQPTVPMATLNVEEIQRTYNVQVRTVTPTVEPEELERIFNVRVRPLRRQVTGRFADPHRRRAGHRGRCGGSGVRPVYPVYGDAQRRRMSFRQVPLLPHHARSLADFGFFAENADQVFCWRCGLQVTVGDLRRMLDGRSSAGLHI